MNLQMKLISKPMVSHEDLFHTGTKSNSKMAHLFPLCEKLNELKYLLIPWTTTIPRWLLLSFLVYLTDVT